MNPFVHDALPGRIVFGAGSVDRAADEAAALGIRRALVIASGSAKPAADRIAEGLGDRHAATFAEVRQHVPEELAAAARRAALDAGADGVVTVGGGSAIGLGKAVAVAGGQPIVAVPTTYSGSEMTPIYGITGEHKRTGRDSRVLPKVVIYDPVLTTGLPARATASSGFNALAHCVEALYAPGTNPVVQLFADAGLRVLAASLPAAVDGPHDVAARGDALYGAYLAGAALAVAGTALHHKLCHVLGGSFGLVHADVNAVILPHVVAYNAPAAPGAIDRVAAALGATDAAMALFELARRLGAPSSLATLGMPADGLDEAARLGVTETGTTNPRRPDVGSLRGLLQRAYQGDPPGPG